MRYEKGHKGATYDRILDVATRRFRRDGIAASGVAGIMSEAGLTNGAFYAHFSSKSDMIKTSLERAVDEQWQQFENEIAAGHLLNIIRAYLSEEHRDHADSGCPAAALLPEISRQDPATRHVYTESVKRLIEAVESQLNDLPDGPTSREIAIGTLGLLIGTLQMARAVNDSSLSRDILAAGTEVALTLIQSGQRPKVE